MANDRHGPMTPVPRSFLDTLSNDLSEIKKDTRSTNEAVVELRTDMRATKARVKKLEDNTPCKVVTSVQADTKDLALKVNTAEANIAEHNDNLNEIKQQDSKRIYWILGAALLVIGSVVGWLTTMATMEANVQTLQSEQTKMRDAITNLSSVTHRQTAHVQKATEAMEEATVEVKNGKGPTVVEWYKALPQKEKALLQRRDILPFAEDELQEVAPAAPPPDLLTR